MVNTQTTIREQCAIDRGFMRPDETNPQVIKDALETMHESPLTEMGPFAMLGGNVVVDEASVL